jgi:hypothetical protein
LGHRVLGSALGLRESQFQLCTVLHLDCDHHSVPGLGHRVLGSALGLRESGLKWSPLFPRQQLS